MIAKRINGATKALGAPAGWDTAKDGDCGYLWVRIVGQPNAGRGWCESAWELTPTELDQLQSGGSLILRVLGWQPPVALYVEPAPAEEPT